MAELRLNGAPLPATLATSVRYEIAVIVNGAEVTPTSWSVVAASVTVASGYGTKIDFTPVTAVSHTISARATGSFGIPQNVAATVNVGATVGQAEAGVNWAKLLFNSGENLSGRIIAKDSRGSPPSRIVWSIYHNGSPVHSGEGAAISYTGTRPGVYRCKGTAYCFDGTQLSFDSTAFVDGSVIVRHNLPVPAYEGTVVYLGAVYTQNIAAAGGTATSLPYVIAGSTEDIYLLPGTTHWTFDLDPDGTTVDDEVVVRTKKGNWCLNGLAGGLAGEEVGYDYGFMPTYIPAPVDLKINLTAQMLKVNGLTFSGFNSRVRIKCYRLAPNVYRYKRCGNTSFPGGVGRRNRRWAAMFTRMDVQTDVGSGGLNRLGTGTAVVPYTTPSTTTVPLMTLSTSGTPHPVPGYSGLYYTDSNLYAYYECDGKFDIAAHALSAIETLRPCCVSLLTFKNTKPLICNRIKRLYGKLVVFLTEGVVFGGSIVNIRVYRSHGLQYTDYALPISTTIYANEDSVLLNVGEIDIDLSDYQFDETGVVIDFSVDESGAVTSPIPDPVPTPLLATEYIYSTTYATSVTYDGGCYIDPTYVPVLDDAVVSVSPIGGCHDPICGPASQYCYTALDAPAESVVVPQPFGFPAPFIAFGSNPSRCYHNPVSTITVDSYGTHLTEYTGSTPVDLLSFTGSGYCGYSYAYDSCQAAYAPCGAYGCSIVVVYPVSSSPHATIEYNGNCFSFAGSTTEYGTRPLVSSIEINPAMDCHDPVCNLYNASGSVVVYNDIQTFLEVPVRFEHLDYGTAYYGAAPQVIDNWSGGLTDGSMTITLKQPETLIYTSGGTGKMAFEFSLRGVRKQLIRVRAGASTAYDPGMGGTRQTVPLQPGDQVYLRVYDPYGRLPLQYRDRRVLIRWHGVLVLPRLFDTVVVPYSGTTSIRALGFCAYTTQGAYSFYGTLPFNGSMTGPVNPDSLVTVTDSGGQEYNVLGVRATGDVNFFPLGIPWYSGQTLNGPFTFKFYAARESFGAHGEMDVWFDTDGTFPAYLRAGLYDGLMLSGTNYRKDWEPTDTNRNSYAVLAAADVSFVNWPCAYVASDGQVISVDLVASGVQYNSKAFSALGWPVPDYDPGLSYVILNASAVLNLDSWLTDADDPWLSDAGEEWIG